MTKIHKLDVTAHMPSADKAFLDWFDLTMALPHDYMEEIFRLHARNVEKIVKKPLSVPSLFCWCAGKTRQASFPTG